MKTCYDCIHFKDVCEEHGLYFENEYLKNVAFSENIKDLCYGFKDKADFVEVVLCEKCKDFEPHGNGKAGICRNKKLKPCLRYSTDFCSYGERRDT